MAAHSPGLPPGQSRWVDTRPAPGTSPRGPVPAGGPVLVATHPSFPQHSPGMPDAPRHAADLLPRARTAMLARGFLPDFAPEALAEVSRVLSGPPVAAQGTDLRGLLWSSI